MRKDKIVKKLIKKKISISVAESCTGGLVSNEIISIPGSSKIFNLGIISYSNQSKEKILNVKKKNIVKYGAVSTQVCKEMVENLYKISKSKICISTTGIAGPGGGSSLKPVGLVFIGIKYKKILKIFMFNFNKKFSRKKIQKLTVNEVVNIINNLI
ncbi:MAG: damage-inducible protein CinA [Candidatus Pelagibacter sp.]|nr:damage-inducible protein CinA [Candidatus Pelagibacter sp.]OUV87277.1 MAG: damage-inducible protein CinA [Pelagibacteraceae bacterium TMED136]|tara:strand:+ start:8065 stop:8532 length:468 start_codon:yes stop_codon:yes gene_type:complete